MTIRREDADLVRGRTAFVADLPFEGLHAVFVRSMFAHGTIVSIDADAALAVPGVVAVETAASLGLAPFRHFAALDPRHARHPLADGVVRFVGEAVAVVLAESATAAADAAETVEVEIDALPAVVGAGPDAPLLYAASGTNVVHRIDPHDQPDPTSGAELIVELEVDNTRAASVPIEPDGIVAYPAGDGGLDIWCTSQGVHEIRDDLAAYLGLSPAAVRVRSPAVGGAFGGRATTPVEFAVVAALARTTGHGIRWIQTRWENLTGMPQGRGVRSSLRLALDEDGTIVGLDVHAVSDAGATAHMAGLLMASMQRQMAGMYRVPAVRYEGQALLTTTTPVGAYRGAGQPEANHARERILDVAARRLGVDPIELRRKNLLRADELPHESPGGVTYDAADPVAALDLAVERAGVAAWRDEQRRRRAEGSHREIGVGVACYAQTSGRGTPADAALVRIADSGRVEVVCGSASHGQSHAETWRALVADRLAVGVDLVDVVDADSAAIATGLTTGGSRASQVLGSVLDHTCADIVATARSLAAARLEADAEDLVVVPASHGLPAGLAVAGVPTRRLTWEEIASSSPNRCLEAARTESAAGEAHPYGTHIAVVELDTETGAVSVLAHTAVDDCGVVLQPAFVAGQQHGGSVAGLAQALFECVSYDADGTPETASLLFYLLATAADVPPIDVVTMSTPTERNALGTRGIGENGCNAATAAVHNAVMDALTPVAIEHVDLPLTPERIWAAIEEAGRIGPAQEA